ncbi:50S ribosomal protein L19 [Candidatus Saccharibacteria bacterium]|nr:50S ribosomal protein L19 [Candidatus Saccharibacteria bacterium]
MSFSILKKIGDEQKKKAVVDVRSGDTVKVTQKIKEGDKSRLQVFEGVVIRTDRKDSHTARITVRKIASGVGVEKSFLIHSPLVEKIEIVKRSKVRRKNLSYLRNRSGKSARLANKDFDRSAVNDIEIPGEDEVAESAETAEPAPAEVTEEKSADKPEEKPADEKSEEPTKEEKPAEKAE